MKIRATFEADGYEDLTEQEKEQWGKYSLEIKKNLHEFLDKCIDQVDEETNKKKEL